MKTLILRFSNAYDNADYFVERIGLIVFALVSSLLPIAIIALTIFFPFVMFSLMFLFSFIAIVSLFILGAKTYFD